MREDELAVDTSTVLDDRSRETVQDNVAIDSVFDVSSGDNEYGSCSLCNPNLPAPPKTTHLVLPGSRIHFERRHSDEVWCQLREEKVLLRQ